MLTSRSVLKHAAFVLGTVSPLISLILLYFAGIPAGELRHFEPWGVATIGFGLYAVPLLLLGIVLSPCLRRPHHPVIRYFLGVAAFYLAHVALFALKTPSI